MRRPSGPRVRYGTRPGPQSIRGTKPIDTAPTVAVPIMVKMTRRERFMRSPALTHSKSLGQASAFKPGHSSLGIEADLRSADKSKSNVSQDRAEDGQLVWCQPPPEKCDVNACANEPNPPRVTPLDPESDDVPDEEWLDESPLKKLLRDDDPPDEPWLLLDEDPRGGHSAPVCSPDGAAIPGRFDSQFSPGISA